MPRTRRLDLAGMTQHVIQRGNDRLPCFFRDIDHVRYLQDLRDAASQNSCRIHAYVLMTNHVHLLVTPDHAGAVARMMQAVGRRYVRFVNDALQRTGTLWEGRYKSCLVDSERYVLACQRYIELNPVRAGLSATAAGYRWSSHAGNGLGRIDPVLSPHPVHLELSGDAAERCRRYRALVAQGIAPAELAALRLYAQRQRALGSDRFQAAIERQLHQRAGIGCPGRPRIRAPAPARPTDSRRTRSAVGSPDGSSVSAAEKVL
jgi:putative transposase